MSEEKLPDGNKSYIDHAYDNGYAKGAIAMISVLLDQLTDLKNNIEGKEENGSDNDSMDSAPCDSDSSPL